MNLDILDLRLKLNIDSYLKQFETMDFIDTIMTQYNNLNKVKELSVLNLNDQIFYHNYTNIYKYLSVLSLNRDYDDTELQFIAELAYKQKGSIESLKTIFDIIDCTYSDMSIDKDYTFKLHISYNNVREIYLAQKYLYTLCNDLLFIKSNDLKIDYMSIRYRLQGDSNKRYLIYTTYDLNTKVTQELSTTTEQIESENVYVEGQIISQETHDDITTTKSVINVDSENHYTIETKVENSQYETKDTITIDTYEW